MKVLLKDGFIIDPLDEKIHKGSILIKDGIIYDIGFIDAKADIIFDAKDLFISPGLTDMHVHTRFPGQEWKEDIKTVSQTALAGGVTRIIAMPNTIPTIDNEEVVRQIQRESKHVLCDIQIVGSITKDRRGYELSPMAKLKEAGVVGFSDDGSCVSNSDIMYLALEKAKELKMPLLLHEEDNKLSTINSITPNKTKSSLSEYLMVQRDIEIMEQVGGYHIHICHVSKKKSVELIREAKKRNINITAEAAPHHFSLTSKELYSRGAIAKVNPPLGEEEDVLAVIAGLKDGTIDAIATDHAPHCHDEKMREFERACCGFVGLQTLLPISFSLDILLPNLIKKMTINPNKILNLNPQLIKCGEVANLFIFDPSRKWNVNKETLKSKSFNTPFYGQTMTGKVLLTISGGQIAYQEKDIK